MSAQKGREFLLKVSDGAGGYQIVGGFQSNNFSISSNGVEITSKNSQGFRELLDGGANISIDADGSGVFMNDAGFLEVHAASMANTYLDCQIEVPNFKTYTGNFIVTSLRISGETEGAVTYDISLQSAGVISTSP